MFVVFYHLGFWIWAGAGVPVSYRWPSSLTWFGSVGVEVFFSLSGFVIASSTVHATGLSFVRNRLARLLPGSLICATFTLLICMALHAEAPHILILAQLRSAFLPVRAPFIDSSYWTLPIELTFYALVLLLILLKREWLLPRVIGTVGMLSSAVWIGLSIAFATRPQEPLPGGLVPKALIFMISTRQKFFVTLVPHGCFFAIGLLLWFCLTHRTTAARVAVLCVCMIGGVAETFWHARIELDALIGHPEVMNWTWNPIVPCSIWLSSVALMVAFVRSNHRFTATCQPMLPFIRWAGLLTYPLT